MSRTRNYRTITVSVDHFERAKAEATERRVPISAVAEYALDLLLGAKPALDKSNDRGAVQIEIRAAELVQPDGLVDGEALTPREELALTSCAMNRAVLEPVFGYTEGSVLREMPSRGIAGWLAYEIATHDAQQAEVAPRAQRSKRPR